MEKEKKINDNTVSSDHKTTNQYGIESILAWRSCSSNASDTWSQGFEFDAHLQLPFLLFMYMCIKLGPCHPRLLRIVKKQW